MRYPSMPTALVAGSHPSDAPVKDVLVARRSLGAVGAVSAKAAGAARTPAASAASAAQPVGDARGLTVPIIIIPDFVNTDMGWERSGSTFVQGWTALLPILPSNAQSQTQRLPLSSPPCNALRWPGAPRRMCHSPPRPGRVGTDPLRRPRGRPLAREVPR